MNIQTEGGEKERKNETRCARVDPTDETKPMLIHYENELKSADFTLLGNLFICKGSFLIINKAYDKIFVGGDLIVYTLILRARFSATFSKNQIHGPVNKKPLLQIMINKHFYFVCFR